MPTIKLLLAASLLLFQGCRTAKISQENVPTNKNTPSAVGGANSDTLLSDVVQTSVIYIKGTSIGINSIEPIDTFTTNWIKPLSDSLNAQMNQIIGFTAEEFRPIRSRGRITESQQHKATLARLVSDYTLKGAQEFARTYKFPIPELAVLNHNGLRNAIDSGNITLGAIYEVMPFDNEVVLLVLSGTQMIELFNYIAQIGGTPLSGGELYLDTQTFVSARINGNAFDSRRSYCIATVDFMQGGGDGFTMLKNPKRIIQTGKFLRDVIIEQIQLEMTASPETLKPRNNPRIFHHQ
jgi:2',3'-cyclic-nucleotide 2'-phosphodiesterase (5'-nucleotidase family)